MEAILSSANPGEALKKHETSYVSGSIAPPIHIPGAVRQKMERNKRMMA